MQHRGIIGLQATYQRFVNAKGPTWLDAVADVTKKYGVLQVFSNSNERTLNSNPSIRAAYPYFKPHFS